MTDTIKNEALATGQAGTPKSPPRSTKRRIAREPKAKENAPSTNAATAAKPATVAAPKEPRGPSKIASVITLLQRSEGATLAEMVEATGWLPHTTRAALTGLKKKGHVIIKDKRGDVTCYRITRAN
jgi:hypothetical protein